MRLKRKAKYSVNLLSPEGNAYALIALVVYLGRLKGIERKDVRAIQSRMMTAKLYNEVLDIIDQEFPGMVHFHNDPRKKKWRY